MKICFVLSKVKLGFFISTNPFVLSTLSILIASESIQRKLNMLLLTRALFIWLVMRIAFFTSKHPNKYNKINDRYKVCGAVHYIWTMYLSDLALN